MKPVYTLPFIMWVAIHAQHWLGPMLSTFNWINTRLENGLVWAESSNLFAWVADWLPSGRLIDQKSLLASIISDAIPFMTAGLTVWLICMIGTRLIKRMLGWKRPCSRTRWIISVLAAQLIPFVFVVFSYMNGLARMLQVNIPADIKPYASVLFLLWLVGYFLWTGGIFIIRSSLAGQKTVRAV